MFCVSTVPETCACQVAHGLISWRIACSKAYLRTQFMRVVIYVICLELIRFFIFAVHGLVSTQQLPENQAHRVHRRLTGRQKIVAKIVEIVGSDSTIIRAVAGREGCSGEGGP